MTLAHSEESTLHQALRGVDQVEDLVVTLAHSEESALLHAARELDDLLRVVTLAHPEESALPFGDGGDWDDSKAL